MKSKVLTTSSFARKLGFKDAHQKQFRQLLKLATKRKFIKIQQGGFYADSMHHPKLVVLMKPFEEVKFIQNTVFPSHLLDKNVDGFRLTKRRTGFKRLLKSGEYSKHKWWFCEDCGIRIKVGQPYASKVDYSRTNGFEQHVPVFCKCVPCFLDLVEEIHGLD